MKTAREIIVEAIELGVGIDTPPEQIAISVTESLAIEGHRILAPGELCPETLERAAQIVEQMPWYNLPSPDHVTANKPADYAAVIRSLDTKGEADG